jgi:hypothetical protein
MKKYEVPVMRLHKLKPNRILCGSSLGAANTQSYEMDENFNSETFFSN